MEKCFLFHEAARAHLVNNRFDDAKNYANRVLHETAKTCQSNIWSYLAILVLCKSDVITSNIIKGRENFIQLVEAAKKLKSPFLVKVSSYAKEVCTLCHVNKTQTVQFTFCFSFHVEVESDALRSRGH